MDSLNEERQGVTELRVHGVGGTRPEAILDDPHLRRVSGDDLVGFYRPASQSRPGFHREALSWGKITAGDAAKALWVLLLPFALANLAGWTHPPGGPGNDPGSRANERFVQSLVRLFCLSITIGATLMIANMLLDIVALQCGGEPVCRQERWWLAIFGWEFVLNHPARRLAIGALLCALAVLFLLWVGRASYRRLEEYDPEGKKMDATRTKAEQDEKHPPSVELAHPDFWRGAGPVGQLRDLHAGTAVITITSLVCLAVADFADGPIRLVSYLIAAVAVAGIAYAAVRLIRDDDIYRRLPVPEPRRLSWFKKASFGLLFASLILTLPAGLQPPASPRLESLDISNMSFFAAEGVLLLLMFITLWRRRRSKERHEPGEGAPEYAFHGLGAFGVSATSLFILSSMWSGGLIRLADLLGKPQMDGIEGIYRSCPTASATGEPESEGILCYAQYHQKTAIVALVVLAAAIAVFVRAALWLRGQAKACKADVIKDLEQSGWQPPAPLPQETERRLHTVAKSYGLSTLVANSDSFLLRIAGLGSATALAQHFLVVPYDAGERLVTFLSSGPWRLVALLTLVVAVMLPIGEQPEACEDPQKPEQKRAPLPNLPIFFGLAFLEGVLSLTFVRHLALANAASWAVTLLPVGAVIGLYASLRNPNLRRGIGIIWDVITFWPRHNHPFAPPCYGERVVPQLKYRLERLTGDPSGNGLGGRVLLSGHSQGSVLAVAALLQVEPMCRRRIALFTYGSPLEILYKRLFPAYFGGGIFRSLQESLQPANIRVPWQHFYCKTDPIGVPMSELADGHLSAEQELETVEEIKQTRPLAQPNTHLLDPHTWEALRGEPPWPLRRHSAYLEHPSFLKSVDAAMEELAAKA